MCNSTACSLQLLWASSKRLSLSAGFCATPCKVSPRNDLGNDPGNERRNGSADGEYAVERSNVCASSLAMHIFNPGPFLEKAHMIAYVHGFNSSPESNTFGMLRKFFPDARALDYPSSGLFPENLARLQKQAREINDASSPFVLVGASLGGFYASQLSALLLCNCVLINPVVRPAQSLRQFLGPNTTFYGGQHWEFTRETCDSYSFFADARSAPVKRMVVLGLADTLLDPKEARAYWEHCAYIHETNDGHSLAALDETIVHTLRDWQ